MSKQQHDRRIFLGWDKPVVAGVVEHLVAGRDAGPGQPLDLKDVLVVVPTHQAGRRLREALARWCDERDACLLSADVVTTSYFFRPERLPPNVAGPVATRILWVEILMRADMKELGTLFPTLDEERSFVWALNTAEILEKLRKELSDGAMTIADVVETHAEELEELDRWQELAKLEQMFLDKLTDRKLLDTCRAKIDCSATAGVELPVERVVVAAVPDPSLLAIKALEHVADNSKVEVLVHAPVDRKSAFDDLGRPIAARWVQAHIDIPDLDNDVFLEATPADQGRRVLDEIVSRKGDFESGEIALGVPDTSVIPCLERELGSAGLPPFDPSDISVMDHALGRLAQSVLNLIQTQSYQATAALLRHPDMALSLEKTHDLKMLKVLEQLDGFQNYYLPRRLEHMLAPFEKNERGTYEPRDDFTDLGNALKVINELAALFTENDLETAWRECFRRVYTVRRLDRANVRDSEFENAAMALDGVLREFRGLAQSDLDLMQLCALFVRQLNSELFHRERRDEVLDLEGWLELPWNDRPFLLVTGLNDDFVPGGSMSDAFLPDSLRGKLGLRDDKARFARDVFLMTGMIESRRTFGRACFILGKTGSAGDPLKPSRLLFRCPDNELPARVEKLLASIKDTKPRPAAEVIFKLRPADAGKKKDVQKEKYVSVTAFRDYLACPFRFYLKHVLDMEPLNDRKTGLDAMDFGNIIHEVLKVMGRDRDLWACADAGILGEHLAELAEKNVVRRFGSPLPLAVHISLLAAVERLKAFARVQVALVQEGWDIIEAEAGENKATRDRWRLKRNGFTISGRIDRIDKNRHTGQIRIIDYKTSDGGDAAIRLHLGTRYEDTPEWNKAIIYKQLKSGAKAQEKRWLDLQLPLYAMIYAQDNAVPDDLEVGYFNLPKAVSQTRVDTWPGFSADIVDSARACVDGVLNGIAGGLFWAPSDYVRYEDFGNLFYFEPADAIDTGGFAS